MEKIYLNVCIDCLSLIYLNYFAISQLSTSIHSYIHVYCSLNRIAAEGIGGRGFFNIILHSFTSLHVVRPKKVLSYIFTFL